MHAHQEAATDRRDEVTISAHVDQSLIPDLWTLYADAFEPMRELALLSHLYPRDLFDELIADPRVFKVIAWHGDQPIGLAAVTNVLDLVPQISPPFLRRRFPEQSLRQAVYFAMFICVTDRYRTGTMFARLIAGMGQVAATRQGLVVCDISRANCDAELHTLIGRIVGWFPGSSFEEVDSQHYFAAVLPETLERLPFSRAAIAEPIIDLRERPGRSAGIPHAAPADDAPAAQR